MQPWFVLYIKLSLHPPGFRLRPRRFETTRAHPRARRNRVHERIVNCCGRFVREARQKCDTTSKNSLAFGIYIYIYMRVVSERVTILANAKREQTRKRNRYLALPFYICHPSLKVPLLGLPRITRDSESRNRITRIVQSSYIMIALDSHRWRRRLRCSTPSRQRPPPSSFPTGITRSNSSSFLCHLLGGSAGS